MPTMQQEAKKGFCILFNDVHEIGTELLPCVAHSTKSTSGWRARVRCQGSAAPHLLVASDRRVRCRSLQIFAIARHRDRPWLPSLRSRHPSTTGHGRGASPAPDSFRSSQSWTTGAAPAPQRPERTIDTGAKKLPVPRRVPELAAETPTREFSMPTIGEYSSPMTIVLPHVILLPTASPRMLPVARRAGSGATYGARPLTPCTACCPQAITRFCNVCSCRKLYRPG